MRRKEAERWEEERRRGGEACGTAAVSTSAGRKPEGERRIEEEGKSANRAGREREESGPLVFKLPYFVLE